jgi:hypothetical protein
MADDPDTMRARLDRLTELVELARQVPWEDHGHVGRAPSYQPSASKSCSGSITEPG